MPKSPSKDTLLILEAINNLQVQINNVQVQINNVCERINQVDRRFNRIDEKLDQIVEDTRLDSMKMDALLESGLIFAELDELKLA